MDRERLDRWLEHGILSLVCIILIAAPFLFGATRLIDFMWIQGLTAAALILWMIRFWVRSEYRILWPPLAWAILVFLGYVIWRYTGADVEYAARQEMNRILVYAALFFIVLDNFSNKEWTQVLVCTLIFVGMGAAMYAIYQYATGSHKIYNTPQPLAYYGRAGGPFVCPNHLAGYVGMVVPLAFGLVLMARLNIVLKILIGYAGVVMLAGAFVSLSRAGCAALAFALAGMMTILLFNRDYRLRAIVVIALILIPAAWIGSKNASAQARINKGFGTSGFGDDRFIVWPAATSMWRENFWTGVGPAHFDLRYRPYRPPLTQLQARPEFAHNDYLNTLADYGMIGFGLGIIAVGIFWLGVVRVWRYVRRGNDFGSKQSTRAAIILGASAGLVALMLHCIVDFNLHIPALAIVCVTLMAIITSHWRFATERFWIRPGVVGRSVGTLACAAMAAWLGFNTVRTVSEQRLILRAEKMPEHNEAYRDLMKQAFATDSKNSETAYWIGSSLRREAWNGAGAYQKQTEEAIEWFNKAMALDPYTPQAYIGVGMCLDFLDRRQEAWPYFRKALVLDPHNYYVLATYGWHLIQFQAWLPAAKKLAFSLGIQPNNNTMARSYFDIAVRKLDEQNRPPEVSKPEGATPPPAQQTSGTTK
jgi:O-antigen ligase